MNRTDATLPITLDGAFVARLPAVLPAMLLGTLLFVGVAFAGPIEVHNAAHDGRHTFAFPCH